MLSPRLVDISNAASATIKGLEVQATPGPHGAACSSLAKSRGSRPPTTATLPWGQAIEGGSPAGHRFDALSGAAAAPPFTSSPWASWDGLPAR